MFNPQSQGVLADIDSRSCAKSGKTKVLADAINQSQKNRLKNYLSFTCTYTLEDFDGRRNNTQSHRSTSH